MFTLRRTRRVSLVIVTAALLCLVAYGVGWAIQVDSSDQARSAQRGSAPDAPLRDTGNGTENAADPSEMPSDPTSETPTRPAADPPSDGATTSPEQPNTSDETDEPGGPDKSTSPEPQPGPALLTRGSKGTDVRDLQARLAQIDWFNERVTGFYGDVTTAAVRGFQAKRGIAVTGAVDQQTLDLLAGMTREPTAAELSGEPSTNAPGALDKRCLTGRVLCIDKSSRTLRWVVDGQVQKTVDVRFGAEYSPTREGVFSVYRKSRDHVSSIYHTAMPYAMFFSGGQAVHYSSDFAAVGYNGASHGCVNVRDEAGVAWLFDHVRIGDKVVVYWS